MKTLHLGAILLVGVFMSISFHAKGQESVPLDKRYDYIKDNQDYLKITILKEGVYTLSSQELISNGLNVSMDDLGYLQLFNQGQEVPILILQSNESFSIKFHGLINQEVQESILYHNTNNFQQKQGIFSNYNVYFLTINKNNQKGKRILTQPIINPNIQIAQATGWQQRQQKVYNDVLSNGTFFPHNPNSSDYLYKSTYDETTIWTSSNKAKGKTLSHVFDLSNFKGGDILVDLRILNVFRKNASVEIEYGSNSNNTKILRSVDIKPSGQTTITATINNYEESQKELYIAVTFTDGSSPYISVDHMAILYDENINSIQQSAFIKATGQTQVQYDIKSIPNNFVIWHKIGLQNIKNIQYALKDQTATFILNQKQDAELIFSNKTMTPYAISKVNFEPLNKDDNFIIITHKDFINSKGVNDYIAYRSSVEGGEYKVSVWDIEKLYDHFSFGIRNPLAINSMLSFYTNANKQTFVLILGKGVNESYKKKFKIDEPDNNALFKTYDFIPTLGLPSSDQLFKNKFDGDFQNQFNAFLGRVPITKEQEISNYLAKVKTHEAAIFNQSWRKNILHLSGGITKREQDRFKSIIGDLKEIAQSKPFGANVYSISKTRNTVSEVIDASALVNEGVSLITFFGHSGFNNTDIEIGFVSNDFLGYRNKGKYPQILINGCNAGDIFNRSITFGEDWLKAKDKGAISVIANAFNGYTSELKEWSQTYYNLSFANETTFGKTIGEIVQLTNQEYLEKRGQNDFSLAQVQQTVLQGDPALRLFAPKQPNIIINEVTLVEQKNDALIFEISLSNTGKSIDDKLDLAIADEQGEILQTINIQLPINTEQFIVNLPQGNLEGQQVLRFIIDPEESKPYIRQDQSVYEKSFFIKAFKSTNIYPANNAIVSLNEATLYAYGERIGLEEKQFDFEIDISSLFNSPQLQKQTVKASQMAAWKPDFAKFNNNQVFYWRSKPSEVSNDFWVTSSFSLQQIQQDLATHQWKQSDFDQFLENDFLNVSINKLTRQILKTNGVVDVSVSTFGGNNPDLNGEDLKILIDGSDFAKGGVGGVCQNNALMIFAIDATTNIPYLPLRIGKYDQFSKTRCGLIPQLINTFKMSQLNTANTLLTQAVDGIKNGDGILLFSIGTIDLSALSDESFVALSSLGISKDDLTAIMPGIPFAIKGRKGAMVGDFKPTYVDGQNLLQADFKFVSSNSSSEMLTNEIGPAASYQSINFKLNETLSKEDYKVQVLGIKEDGTTDILVENVDSNDLDISTIDAKKYPYLKLKVIQVGAEDRFVLPEFLTVEYKPYPELVLFFDDDLEKQNVLAGQSVKTNFSLYNFENHHENTDITLKVFNTILRVEPFESFEVNRQSIAVTSPVLDGAFSFDAIISHTEELERIMKNNRLNTGIIGEVFEDPSLPIMEIQINDLPVPNNATYQQESIIKVIINDTETALKQFDSSFELRVFVQQLNCENCSTDGDVYNYDGDPTMITRTFRHQLKKLPAGEYQLIVEFKDEEGIRRVGIRDEKIFEIADVDEAELSLKYVFPIPATSFFNFKFTGSHTNIENITLSLMNIQGERIMSYDISKEALAVNANRITISFNGTNNSDLIFSNGIYIYILECSFKNGTTKIERGKLIVEDY